MKTWDVGITMDIKGVCMVFFWPVIVTLENTPKMQWIYFIKNYTAYDE